MRVAAHTPATAMRTAAITTTRRLSSENLIILFSMAVRN
jgi:hypothetical protein